ncbi:LamG domain-containing protein [Okeania sp. SIO1F9]|uniref:LamG domain-containing protein n=1 Tax=Okeania sp. SIO1F9 TaxID=2607813 RepID=UPI0014505B7C|nr:LamG domain-containing protein [Okeania sp. SIO1F9]NET80177.1 hypothetical protein [Okeania sp. SIO1F9]
MSEVATKNLTFWDTTDYKYPGFGQTAQISDGLGGTIGITYNQIDYNDRGWKGKPNGDTPITEDRLLSGEIENKFSLTGKVKGITVTMPQIRTIGRENNYSVTLDFSNYKASLTGSKATDGATCGDTYLAISRFFNGTAAGYTTIKVTATTLDGSPLNLTDWKLFNSGTLGQGNNARVFLDAATQTISGKNSQGKQEFCPTPPNPGTSFGTDTGLGLFQLPSDQRYTSITLTFKQKKIKGVIPNDLHDIYVASNTTSTSPISKMPETKPMDISSGLQLHLPLNEIVENAAKEKEVVDISGGKLNGKVHGATIVADSNFGNCLSFDGVDDYIQMPEMNIDYSKGITVEVWVYYNSFKYQSRVIDFANGPGKNNIIFGNHTTTNDGLLVVFVGSTRKAIEVKGILEASKWLHLTATIDESGNAKVYKNGQEVGGGLVAVPNSVNRTKNYIGVSNWSGTGYFHGKMTNLRIYDRVLSPEEINECMKVDGTPPPMDINSGLQLHLPLNEIVENAAKEKEVVDISAGKLNGKVYGATVVAEPRFGNCLNFNGNHDYVIINPMPNFPSEAMTVLCWVRSNNQQKEGTVISYAKSSAQRYNEFQIYNIKNITPTVNNKWYSTGVAFNDGEWHCVAITWQSSDGQFKVYKDGKEVHSKVISQGNPIATGGALVLGQEQDKLGGGFAANQAFQGQMAHLRMYNRVLSPEDINECMKEDGTPPPIDINRGLQFHLPLNEIVENAAKEKEVVDVSAAKLNGKVNGKPIIVADSKLGNCLSFDGVDDYIQMPAMNIDYSQGLTVEAWIHYNSFKHWSRIIDFGNGTPNNNIVFANETTTSNLCFDSFKGTTSNRVQANGKLELSKWLHLAVTVDGSGKTKIYKNGTEVESGLINLPNNTNRANNYIGKSNWSTDGYFQGKMSNLRMYNRALSPEEINECMKVDQTPPPMDINRGLQLHLPLDEIVENAAKEKEVVDVSPAKLNGKVNGKPIVVADSKLGNCLNFDGVDDYIQMPEMNIDYSQGLTVEAWVHYSSFKSWSRIIDFGKGPGNNNILFANESTTQNLVFDVYQGATRNRIKVDGMLELNQWLYLTVTVDGSGSGKIYKNGEEVQSGLVHLPNNLNRTKNYIGDSNWSADGFFHGKMSHLRMYNRALSPEEINECMKVDGTPPPMDINRGLQLHLPLNEIVENAAKEKEVVDISAGKLNGKVNGATVVADDRFGNCINFDGTKDYIELPTATIPETGEITISFWANGGKSLPNQNSIILAQDKSNHRVVNIHLPWSNSNVYFDCGNTTTTDNSYDRIEKPSQASDFKDRWTYWVFTKNVATGEMKIYLNGSLWQSGVGKENPLSSITQVKFGCGYGFYNGKVAHLRIYDRVLSPEEINELMTVDETTGETDTTPTTDETETTGETDSTSTTDETGTTGETDSTSTTDETGTTGETDSTSITDETGTTGETDSTSITDETGTTGETDSTSTTDETETTGETDSTSTTDETETTGETDSTSTTDETETTGETDSTSTTDQTPKPIDINSGLHLHLPLNEIVENSAKEKEVVDASDGTLNGKVYGAEVIADPNFGDCIGFDGVDDYIELPPTAIPETNELTISFWANGGESLPKQSSILLAEDKTNNRVVNIHLPWSDSTVYFDCGNKTSSFDRIEQLAQVSDFKGKWNHWVFTKNITTGEMKIYLNGSLWQTVTGKDQELSQITQIKLGCGYGFYEGKVAHLRIYDRVLSQEEINELMKVNQPATTSTTGETDATSTTDETDTTQKPMEYRTYQVKGNPTIKTGYSASEWTAVIAGFNSGAKQKHKASALTIMPVVEDEEWKIKCDIKDTDDRYWDVAVLFIKNNMVNRVNNFYR